MALPGIAGNGPSDALPRRRSPTRWVTGVNDLQRGVGAAANRRSSTVRRRQSLVRTVLSQVLPPAAIKGGTGLKLRLGEAMTRQTPCWSTTPNAPASPRSRSRGRFAP
ncbi:MAG: hypothetical protein ACT4QF_03400 [Sporichthyaceae bacterium]